MGKWITPQELYESVAKELEEHYQRDPEHTWFRLTVPWEQVEPEVKEMFLSYALRGNKQLYESSQQSTRTKKRRYRFKRGK